MIDFHTHILPGIDDGSANVEESTQLLIRELQQGVAHVVFTPHFYAEKISIGGFLKKREASWNSLRERIGKEEEVSGMTFRLGAEVRYFPGISKAERLDELLVRDRNLLLLEMPFMPWTKEMRKDVENLLDQRGFTVVLAHIERYVEFQKSKENKDVMESIFRMPVVKQMNAGALLNSGKAGFFGGAGKGKSQKFILKYLEEHTDGVLSSDCHHLDRRFPNLGDGMAFVEKKLGREKREQMEALGKRLFFE